MKFKTAFVGSVAVAMTSLAIAQPFESATQSVVARSAEHVRIIPEEMIPLPMPEQLNYRDQLKVNARPGDEVIYQLSAGSAYVLEGIEFKNPADSQYFTSRDLRTNPSRLSIVVKPDAPNVRSENLLLARDQAGQIVKIDPLIIIGDPF